MAASKNDAPFTYSGSWDITEYSPGLFYARFLTSGTLTPKQPFTCDAFLVGGGGGGGGGAYVKGLYGQRMSGGGGGGGRTYTRKGISIGSAVSVTIGSGGSAGRGALNETGGSNGGAGSATIFGSYSASGGDGGKKGWAEPKGSLGGNGGSGGGGGGSYNSDGRNTSAGAGGSDGNKGGDGREAGGSGQGSTTRAFGGDKAPFSAMSFSGGGGGGSGTTNSPNNGGAGGGGDGNGGSGSTNTGGGGGGGNSTYDSNASYNDGGSGGSGIVIIRGVLNLAPTTPDGITYGQPNAGKPLLLTTGGSTDPDGDSLSYVWEHRTDSGVYTQIGVTTESQITATVPTSGTTYQARVKAVDAKGAESGYTTGQALGINYNNAPTISGEDEDKGALTAPPTYTYTVDDEDADQTLTVTESVVIGSNSIPLRTFEATRGTQYTADATAAWLRLPDDATHTLRIQVDDGAGGTAQRDITFTRTVERIAAARAVSTDAKVYKCLVSLYPDDRPADSTIHCEVSNNPFDDAPVWEDISDKLGRYVHVFDNQTSDQLGFAVRFWLKPGTEDVTVSQMAVRIA